jgi:hypothetical protein
MRNFLEKLDRLAAIEVENNFIRWMERAAFVFMILMFVCAPHSIAATQIAWLTGMFIWAVRMFFKPRPPLVRTPLDVALWVFFAWSIITSIFSYDPLTSLDKLRNVALFLIFYYVVNVVKTKRAVVFLAFAIITSTMVSVVWTPVERIIGRGVEIVGSAQQSPLSKALLINGDTLLKANERKIKTPDDLIAEMQENEATELFVYRPDYYFKVTVKRDDLLGGAGALERLGISDWKRSRNWRSAGFYGHYTTFAEVLQLVASLTFGLFITALVIKKRGNTERKNQFEHQIPASSRSRVPAWLLAVCLAGMSFALLLTVTRASQLAFLISAAVIILLIGNRKMILTAAAIILPIALIGLVLFAAKSAGRVFRSDDASTETARLFTAKVSICGQAAREILPSAWEWIRQSVTSRNGIYTTTAECRWDTFIRPRYSCWSNAVCWGCCSGSGFVDYGRTLFKVISQKAKIKNQENDRRNLTDWRTRGTFTRMFRRTHRFCDERTGAFQSRRRGSGDGFLHVDGLEYLYLQFRISNRKSRDGITKQSVIYNLQF